jgi:hypothetical protein
MKRIINGKLYNTETAIEVASDRYWDGHNWERGGRNTYLFKTRKGNFFRHDVTCWQGERDSIEPLSEGEAKELYEELPEHSLDWEDAFGEVPEEA